MFIYWKTVLGIALIFLLGCLAGGFGTGAYLLHRQTLFIQGGFMAVNEALEKGLHREIKLDDDQSQQIHQILTDASEQIKETRKQIQPQIHAIQEQARRRIAALLRPDQKEGFHRVLVSLKKRQMQNGFNPDRSVSNAPPPSPYLTPPQPTNLPVNAPVLPQN